MPGVDVRSGEGVRVTVAGGGLRASEVCERGEGRGGDEVEGERSKKEGEGSGWMVMTRGRWSGRRVRLHVATSARCRTLASGETVSYLPDDAAQFD